MVACVLLVAASCGKREISSVCLDEVPPTADQLTMTVLLEHRLPGDARIISNYSASEFAVIYRDQRHEIVRRAQGAGTCFDFNPPIQLDAAAGAAPGNSANAAGLWQVVSDYWAFFLLAACAVLVLGGIWSLVSDRSSTKQDTDNSNGSS